MAATEEERVSRYQWWLENRSPAAKRRKAEERAAARAARDADAQLALIAERPGKSEKETQRLLRQLEKP